MSRKRDSMAVYRDAQRAEDHALVDALARRLFPSTRVRTDVTDLPGAAHRLVQRLVARLRL